MKQRVREDTDFVRDTKTTAILNTDSESLAAYKKKRNREQEFEMMKADINSLKENMKTIIKLLSKEE